VAVVGETFGDTAVRNMAARMRASPTGRQILADRPRITVSVLLVPLQQQAAAAAAAGQGVCMLACRPGLV
jgi:hypothetical protein